MGGEYEPNILNIGGGYSWKELETITDWKNYIDFLSDKKLHNKYSYTWWNRAYGIHVWPRWWIEWREIIDKRYHESDSQELLQKMLTYSFSDNIPLIEKINDSMFQLQLEPGYALANNVWISIVEIIAIKKVSRNKNALIVNANIFNFSSRMWEDFTDPILIKKENTAENNTDSYFIMGNLCRDDDILIQREIIFDKKPEVWDIVCFINTASYNSDFEEWTPIQQVIGKKLIAKKESSQFILYEDNLNTYLWYTQK